MRSGTDGRDVHNVLIVNHGLARVRTSFHVVEDVNSLELGDTPLKGIDDAVAVRLQLDDGTKVDLALDRSHNPLPESIAH
jgi:hypothetical protein